MVVETRYFRNDYVLGTEQSSSSVYVYKDVSGSLYGGSVGIRVFKVKDDVETEITSDVSAQVTVSVGESGYKSNTVSISEQLDFDFIRVKVYFRFGSANWDLKATFDTENLNAEKLDSATWTVYYYLSCTYNSRLNSTRLSFTFGSSSFNSRIEGFAYTPISVGGHDKMKLLGVK